MKKLLLVHAPGLPADQAVRGDVAANLSDIIAEGSFAPLSGAADVVAGAVARSPGAVETVTLEFRDIASFDAAVGELRARAAAGGASIAVVSDTVFISQHYFPQIKPGGAVAAGDLPRLLTDMIK